MTVGLLSLAAAPSSFNGKRLQTNLNFLQNGGDDPFSNRLKCAQAWTWFDNTSVDPLTPDLFNSDGWPVASAKFTTHGGVTVGNTYIPTQTELPGDWVLKWDGGGTVAVGVALGGGSISTVSGGATSSPWRFNPGSTAFALNVSITGVGPTNLRLYNVNDNNPDVNPFSAKFLFRMQQFGVIRFLNWQSSNVSNVTTWDTANRPVTYYQYNSTQSRSDLLCNLAGSGVTSNSGADYTVSVPSTWAGLANGATVHLVWNASSPTSGTITFAGGGSPNITWTAHGLSNGNQAYVTTTGTLPTGISPTTLGVLPSIYYFVTVIDPDTITLSLTSGGAAINFATTGSGTHTGRTNVTLNIGGVGAVQVISETSSQLTASGNTFPIGGSQNSLSTLTYSSVLNAWIKKGGTISPGGIQNGVPISLLLDLCRRVGAHPWLIVPGQTLTPMTDYAPGLLSYVIANAQSWMVPRYEGPNETWNTFGNFLQTPYANSIAQIYGWGTDYHNWYGKVESTLGQAVAAAYGVVKANVKTQIKYQMICSFQTSTFGSPSAGLTSAPRLTAAKYVANTGGMQSPPQSGYALDPASDWVTHVCGANYITPGYYGRNQEVALAQAYNVGDATAKAAAAASYETSIDNGFSCTFTNGSPGTINIPGNALPAGTIVSFVTTGTFRTGISGANFWVLSAGDSFTLSSTDPYNGGSTPVTISGADTGTTYCLSWGNFTLKAVSVYLQNIAALGATNSVNKLTCYEGLYSPDYNSNAVTGAITAATNAVNCVLTIPTTIVQSIRSPTAQQNTTNPAAVVGQYLKLSGLTGAFAGFNNQTIQVTAVSGVSVTTSLDTSGVGAFSGSGTATFFADASGVVSMATAVNNLRKAGKLAPALQTHTTTNFTDVMAISGAEFPSNYLVGGPDTAWAALEPNVYLTPDPPQWEAIKAFNA